MTMCVRRHLPTQLCHVVRCAEDIPLLWHRARMARQARPTIQATRQLPHWPAAPRPSAVPRPLTRPPLPPIAPTRSRASAGCCCRAPLCATSCAPGRPSCAATMLSGRIPSAHGGQLPWRCGKVGSGGHAADANTVTWITWWLDSPALYTSSETLSPLRGLRR